MQRILIVDSSPDLHTLYAYIFKPNKFIIDNCNNIDSIFDNLQSSIPDLMIVDIAKSGTKEKAVCDDLKAQSTFKHVPIIITSTRKSHVDDYKSFNANDAIEKPFCIDEMQGKVKSLLPAF